MQTVAERSRQGNNKAASVRMARTSRKSKVGSKTCIDLTYLELGLVDIERQAAHKDLAGALGSCGICGSGLCLLCLLGRLGDTADGTGGSGTSGIRLSAAFSAAAVALTASLENVVEAGVELVGHLGSSYEGGPCSCKN